MRWIFLTCFAFCIQLSLTPAAARPCGEVVAYYASWKWYQRNKLVSPENIDYSKYTIINYAFFKPLADGTVREGDSFADPVILLGPEMKGSKIRDASRSLVCLARKNGVKVIGSVGGWTWSESFRSIAADPQKRLRFAHSCLQLVQKYGLDGIDVDWEFPGKNGSQDKLLFTELIKQLRQTLDQHQAFNGDNLMVTVAIGPAPVHMDAIDWQRVTPLVDLVHVMAYNFSGAWDSKTGHIAPLHAPYYSNERMCAEGAVKALLEKHLVPAYKITLGIPFFGRSTLVADQASIQCKSAGKPAASLFPEGKGSPPYYAIVQHPEQIKFKFDHQARSSYGVSKNGIPVFLSFDDTSAVSAKAEYAAYQQLAGIMIWELTGDYVETGSGSGSALRTPLADAINAALCRVRMVADGKKNLPGTQ